MQTQWSYMPEDEREAAAPAQPCATCGLVPPGSPPPANDDFDGVDYMMMRGRWLRYMGLGKGTWFQVAFDGYRIIATPIYPPGFRMLHIPTRVLREVYYTQVREYRHHPRPRRRKRT